MWIHLAAVDRSGGGGDLCVLAQRDGDGDSQRHRAAAILGTAGVMYVLGYSLDNLSLMALTIAVGFVVDDAIVMLKHLPSH
jgi:hypothetical protein